MFVYYALVVSAVLILYYFLLRDRHTKEPPGPRPWPIIGNLLDLAKASDDMSLAMGILSKKYGEIYSLRIGSKRTVIVTSKEAMQTIFCNEDAFGRDVTGMFADRSFHKNLGVAMSEGEVWEKSRAWTFRTMREFGFAKSADMDRFFEIATKPLFAMIEDKISTGSNLDIELFFNTSVLAIIWQMVVGRLSPEDRPRLKLLSEKGDAFIRCSVFGTGIVNAFPVLRYIFPKTLGYDVQMDFFSTCNEIAKKLYQETETEFTTSSIPPTNFVEAFIQNGRSDPKIFNCENFQVTFQDLLLASTDTSSAYMEWVLLFLITYPDIQEKIYQEILKVAPDGRDINYSMDKKGMTYIQAFFMEAHRHGRILQNGVPRRALRDISYKDYIIKKDTIIMWDTRLYYEDKSIWTDPEVFRPERFLNEDGQIVNSAGIISFSFGKRNCPGELQANIVSFQMITAILQRYKLSIPKGQPKPRLDSKIGLTMKPYPFQATFTKRK